MTTWCVIPVRGGSLGLPGKNRRNLNGKPLVAYSIETALKTFPHNRIYLASDDEELLNIASEYSIKTYQLSIQSGKETLDDVVYEVVDKEIFKLGTKDDIIVTVQATCPLLKVETLKSAIKKSRETKQTVMTVTDSRHLYWKKENSIFTPHYEKRLNRQELPEFYKETGAIVACSINQLLTTKTRISTKPSLIVIDEEEAVDIDSFSDFYVAESVLKRKRVLIKADSSSKVGMGHLYRSSTLAYELCHHELKVVSNTMSDKNLSASFFKSLPYEFETIQKDEELISIIQNWAPNLVILDQLDTEESYVEKIKSFGAKIISFEDMGDGANKADLVISDLYKNYDLKHEKQLNGFENSIVNYSFEWVEPKDNVDESVKNILVMFGGADPSNLGDLALSALQFIEYSGQVTLIQGMGSGFRIESLEQYGLKGKIHNDVKYMPQFMKEVDLAISSAGRSINELMICMVPTICICQNEKELNHTHASQLNGILNLGLGAFLNKEVVAHYLKYVIENTPYRQKMKKRMKKSISKRKNNREILERASKAIGLELF